MTLIAGYRVVGAGQGRSSKLPSQKKARMRVGRGERQSRPVTREKEPSSRKMVEQGQSKQLNFIFPRPAFQQERGCGGLGAGVRGKH